MASRGAVVPLIVSLMASFAHAQTSPFAGALLYVDPASPAARQASEWQRSRPDDAALMRLIAAQPQVLWLGDWARDIRAEVDGAVTRMTRAGALPVFVAYNIPNRDCGSHSRGGASGADRYRRWIADFAAGLKRRRAVIILEPDAIAASDCLPALLRDERFGLMRDAVETLTQAGAAVYVDAGHARWHPADEMANRLRRAGIDRAQGFSLNVSNFHPTDLNVSFGDGVSRLVGGKHYIIDTSRNGAGSTGTEWCNPKRQALGPLPTTDTKRPFVDALLWVKRPGESDGTCQGGPKAGEWWADYALELTKMAQVLGSMIR